MGNWIRIAALCALCCSSSRVVSVAVAAPANVFATHNKEFTIEIPESWKLKVIPAKDKEQRWVELVGDGPIPVQLVLDWGGAHQTPQATAWAELAREKTGTVQTTPYVSWTRVRDEKFLDIRIYAVVDLRSVMVRVICEKNDWEKVEADTLAAFKTVKFRDPFRPAPEGLNRHTKDGWTWFVQKGVSGKEFSDVRRAVKAARKAYQKRYGRVEFTEDRSPEILLCKTLQDARNADADAGRAQHGATVHTGKLRLYLTRFPKEGNEERAHRQSCVQSVAALLYVLQNGDSSPRWMVWARAFVVAENVSCGKKLPSMNESTARRLPTGVPTLKVLAESERAEATESYWGAVMSYGFYFEAGAREHRKAYSECVAKLRESHDSATAMAPLLALDQEELKDAVVKWLETKPKAVSGR